MSEHETETAFLRHIILYDDSDKRLKLEENIAQVQQHVRCVQRVASVTAPFPLLAIAGIAYGAILHDNFPFNGAELVFTVLCVLGLASLICLVGFAGLLMVYFKKLHQLRKEARQLAIRLLESRLGKPQIPTLLRSHRVFDDGGAFQDATEVSGYPEIASLT
jgi:hypothetical protein